MRNGNIIFLFIPITHLEGRNQYLQSSTEIFLYMTFKVL